MTISPQDLVNREVHYCVSYLVSTLAGGYGTAVTHVDASGRRSTNGGDLIDMMEQAFELACPIDDWEEALIQNGWARLKYGWQHMEDLSDEPLSLEDAITEAQMDEPYQREVFEHWIVSDWLADKLEAHGEKVDKDFAGLTVWARTTTGQAIYADGVIETICAELNAA